MMTALLRHGADPYATFTKLRRARQNYGILTNDMDDDDYDYDYDYDDDGDGDGDDDEDGDADDNAQNTWRSETCTVIHEIMQNAEIVEPILNLEDLRLETRDAKGQTLLLAASRSPYFVGRFEKLLSRGADAGAQDIEGRTALHHLVQQYPVEKVLKYIRLLLSKNRNFVLIPDNAGDTPLHYALRETCISIEYVDILIENGSNPVQPDSEGNTALHYFARKPSAFISQIHRFKDLGLDINARNKQGNSNFRICDAQRPEPRRVLQGRERSERRPLPEPIQGNGGRLFRNQQLRILPATCSRWAESLRITYFH